MDTITLTAEEYQELVNSRDHAIAMLQVADGSMPTVRHEDLDACFDAPTPLAFWRKHRGHTQTAFAAQLGVSQPYLAQLEAGKRNGDVHLYARMAKLLKVRIEDLVEAPDLTPPSPPA